MCRHFVVFVLLVALVGCTPDDSRARKGTSTTRVAKQPALPSGEEGEGDTLLKPSEDPDEPVEPAQTFERPGTEELAKLKDVPTEELIEHLADDDKRSLAAQALAERGKEAVPTLVQALENEDAEVRAAAVFALGQIGEEASAAVDALRKVQESDDSEVVRDAAAFAIDGIEGK